VGSMPTPRAMRRRAIRRDSERKTGSLVTTKSAAAAFGAGLHVVDMFQAQPIVIFKDTRQFRRGRQARPLLLAAAGRESPDAPLIRVDAPADLGAPGADRLTDDGGRRPSGRREGAIRERCPRNVGSGVFVGRNSGRHSGGREVRPRRQEHSIRRSRAGVGCCQSWEAKSEMSDKKANL
jgi:hypothetical protein